MRRANEMSSADYQRYLEGLALLRQFPHPIWYEYLDGLGLPDGPQIGFLAQEIEAVVPQAVVYGWAPPEGVVPADTRAIRYDVLLCVLINAVRELDTKVHALERQLVTAQPRKDKQDGRRRKR
jgi:hypothetical protein